MAFDPNLEPKTLKKLNLEASKILGNFQSMSEALSRVAKDASLVTGESSRLYKTQSSSAEALSKKLSGLTKSQLKGLDLRKKFQTDLIRLEQESTTRQAKMAELQELVGARVRERIEYEDELLRLQEEGASQEELDDVEDIIASIQVEEAALLKVLEVLHDQEELSKKLSNNFEELEQTASNMAKVNPFTGMSEIVKEVPILRKAFDGLASAADTFNKELAESNSTLKAMGKSILNLEDGLLNAKGILPDIGKGIAAFGIKSAVDGFNRLDESSVALEKSLNMNTTEAINLQKSFINTANTIQGLTASDLNKSLIEANQALGTTAQMSTKTLSTFTAITKQMGISSDEASKLNQFSLASGQNFEDFTNEAIGSVKVLNAVNGTAIDYKGILKDVNNMSSAVKLSTQAQGRNLAEAAYQAKKMGLSMGELDSIAGNLLDFEQSIANELEAELLLGQDLNLEKARAAALDNDLVKMGKELQKQGITRAKFENMNRIEQESIAKAMGMSRESMADMFIQQEALNALNVKGATTVDEAVKKKYEEAMAIKDVEKREKALQKLRETEGAKEITRQLEAQTLAQKAQEAQIEIADTLASAFPTEAITGMKDAMNELAKYIPALTIAIGALTAAILMMKGLKMGMELKQMFKGFKKAGGAADDLSKAVNNIGKNTDDMARAATGSLDNITKAATGSADDAAKAITNSLDNVATSGSGLGKMFKSLKGFPSKALDSISNLGKGINNIASKTGNLVKNITSAGGGVAGAASTMSGSIDDAAKSATNSLDDIAKATTSSAGDAVKVATSSADDAVKVATSSLDNITKSTINSTDDVVKSVTNSLDDVTKTTATTATQTTKSVTSSLDDVAKTAISSTGDVVKTTTSSLDDVAKTAINSTEGIVKTATSSLDDVAKTATNTASQVTKTATSSLDDVVKTAASSTTQATRTVTNSLDDVAKTAISSTDNVIRTTTSSLDDVVKTATNTATQATKTVTNSLDDITKTSLSSATQVTKTATSSLDDVAKTAINSADNVAKSVTSSLDDVVKTATNTATQATKTATSSLDDVVKTATSSATQVTKTATSSLDDVAKTATNTATQVTKTATSSLDDVVKTATTSATQATKTATSSLDDVVKTATTSATQATKTATSSLDDVVKTATNTATQATKTATSSLDDVAKTAISSTDNVAKSMVSTIDDAAKTMTSSLDNVASAGNKLGGIFKSFKGILSGAVGGVKNLAKGIGEAIGKSGNLAKNLTSASSGASSAAGAMGGGIDDAAKAATSTAKGVTTVADTAGDVAGATTKVAKGGIFGKMFSGAKNLVGKTTGAVKGVAGKVAGMAGEALEAVNPMTHVKKFFKGGGGVSKLLKKLPGIGQLIGPALMLYEVSQATGGSADPREVGNATLSALGGLGGGALGSILGSLIPVPIVGTMLGGMAGDYIGRMVADLVSENVDMSSLGQMAIDVFGGQTDTENISPLMAEAGEAEETQIAPDTASDFISRPGQPIQKFRPDDVVIGATNPMGGGNGDNARTIELLERLVAAVEKGGVINMDGNKVGTVLGMSSYRTQ